MFPTASIYFGAEDALSRGQIARIGKELLCERLGGSSFLTDGISLAQDAVAPAQKAQGHAARCSAKKYGFRGHGRRSPSGLDRLDRSLVYSHSRGADSRKVVLELVTRHRPLCPDRLCSRAILFRFLNHTKADVRRSGCAFSCQGCRHPVSPSLAQ